ncbi:hybrid sensor histidine kinase/response regulator [Roseiarcus fermentans]|nr:ATP-binding protein [Roseiarcus fermentans]
MAVSSEFGPAGKSALPGPQPACDHDFLPSAEDGARFVRAFLQIRNPERLQAVLEFVKANEILGSIADGVYALDENWRCVYFNDPAESLLGARREKVMGRLFFDVFPELLGSVVHDNYRRVMDGRTPVQFETMSPVGERWNSYSVSPKRGGGVSVHFHDISERKRAEGEIAKARNEAERANQAKSKFLAAASHDLRQPVQSLVLLMALAERQIAASPQARETLAMMQKSLHGLEGLLTAILDISRLDAGVESHPELVDLAALLRGLALEYQPKADNAGLVLRTAIAPSLWVSTDPALLERALRNLIENAIHYTRRGGAVLGLRRRNGRVRIDVVDTGIGIPRDRQADIFDEFVQIDNPGRNLGRGLGLGLAIVQRIARLLGATVEVNSKIGRGSRFSLLLSGAEQPRGEEAEVAAEVEDPGGRVLIVEDNAVVLKSLEGSLAGWGYEVATASTGEEALRLAEGEDWKFDAIVTDQHLGGGMTGVDMTKAFARRAARCVPAVILTGDTSLEGISQIVASGFQMMHKPVAAESLRRNLARLVRGR